MPLLYQINKLSPTICGTDHSLEKSFGEISLKANKGGMGEGGITLLTVRKHIVNVRVILLVS